jgi:hypothetical protein
LIDAAGLAGAAAGAGAAAVEETALGAAATPDELGVAVALLEVLAVGCDDPQALTSTAPAMTVAPASQRPRADCMKLICCMAGILRTAASRTREALPIPGNTWSEGVAALAGS